MSILKFPTRRALVRAAAATAALALGASLTACSGQTSGGAKNADGTLPVSVSFYPIQYLVEAIGGDHVTVTSVTPTNVEPHDYELSPKDVTGLSSAAIIAYVSGFQPSLDDAVAQVDGPTVVDLAGSVSLEHHDGVSEEHDHDGEGAGDHSSAEAHESETAHDHEHEGDGAALDPHFWLDPQRMVSAANAIEAALSKADPDNAADYKANLATLTTTLEDLDTSYSTGLAQCQRTTFVTSHAAFGYMAERYGLTQTSISGIDPDSEPSPADLAAVKQVVQDTGTTTIFTEELVSPETAEALASETGASTAVLNPIESAPEGSDYAGAMTTNLQELRTALSCQ